MPPHTLCFSSDTCMLKIQQYKFYTCKTHEWLSHFLLLLEFTPKRFLQGLQTFRTCTQQMQCLEKNVYIQSSNMMLNTLTVIFLKNNPVLNSYLGKLLPPTPTAEFCANQMDNSTIFHIILELGTLSGN